MHTLRFTAVALVGLIGISMPAQAHLTRMFGAALHPKDNESDCRPEVQRELRRIDHQRWGDIQFDCRGGFVQSLFFSTNSILASELPAFAKQYWRLFDPEGMDLVDAGYPELSIMRHRQGILFETGYVNFGKRPGPKGGDMLFADFFGEGALPNDFSVRPRVSKKKASARALAAAAMRKHPPNRVVGTDLIIINHCSEKSVPQLVWWVKVSEAKAGRPAACFIDATSGIACQFNDGCTNSSIDGFEL